MQEKEISTAHLLPFILGSCLKIDVLESLKKAKRKLHIVVCNESP